jgi:hypothetical protein
MSAAQILLDDQQQFITDLQGEAGTALFNASIAVAQAKPAHVAYAPMAVPSAYPLTSPPAAPTFSPIELNLPPEPEPMGELLVVSDPNQDDAPVFEETPPTLDFGNQPNQLPEAHLPAPGINTEFAFPEPPTRLEGALTSRKQAAKDAEAAGVELPVEDEPTDEELGVFTAPTITDRAAPDAPDLQTVSFDEATPLNDAVAPTDLGGKYRTEYAEASHVMRTNANQLMDDYLIKINPQYHAQMGRIEAQLETYLAGGTGLNTEVEDAIYDRARAKNDLEAKRVQDAAFADTAARGFTLPGGALTSALARARQDAANNNAKAANEIAIAQAEMEQKNLQFAVTTSASLRTAAVNAMLSYMQGLTALNGQALDYAKSIVASIVQVYDTQVKSFTLKLEAYKAAAQVYDVKVRATSQVIENYKAQIQALEMLTNVDRTKVDVYNAQINSLKVYADLYKMQIETVISKASLEKLKIDLFQSQIQAYAAQVQAKTAEWNGYQARLAGEETRVKVFSAQVDAYNGEVAAYKAKTDGISEKIKSEAARNNAVLQQYTAGVAAYEAGVRAAAVVAGANIDGQRQELTGYQGQISLAVAQANLAVEAYRANVEASALNTKTNMDMQVANVQSGLGQMDALTKIHSEILKVYSGPAAAAAAGMNSLAAINFDE